MSINYATAVRNARCNVITAALDAAATPGKLKIYNGVKPAPGGAVTTLLAELTLGDPSFPAAASGTMSANAITADSSANASGTATWFRAEDGDGNFVLDGTVDELNLNTVEITLGLNVAANSWVVTAGNA